MHVCGFVVIYREFSHTLVRTERCIWRVILCGEFTRVRARLVRREDIGVVGVVVGGELAAVVAVVLLEITLTPVRVIRAITGPV